MFDCMPPFSFPDFPHASMIACKHNFGLDKASGTQRYVTLTATKYPSRAKGAIFGTEVKEQIDFDCPSIEDVCLIADARFQQLFPDHLCNDGCSTKWQPFPPSEPTTKVQ